MKMGKRTEVACAVVAWVTAGAVLGATTVWMLAALCGWMWDIRMFDGANAAGGLGWVGAGCGVGLVALAWVIADEEARG